MVEIKSDIIQKDFKTVDLQLLLITLQDSKWAYTIYILRWWDLYFLYHFIWNNYLCSECLRIYSTANAFLISVALKYIYL